MALHNKGHRPLALPSIQFDKQSYWNSDSSLTSSTIVRFVDSFLVMSKGVNLLLWGPATKTI